MLEFGTGYEIRRAGVRRQGPRSGFRSKDWEADFGLYWFLPRRLILSFANIGEMMTIFAFFVDTYGGLQDSWHVFYMSIYLLVYLDIRTGVFLRLN